MPSFPESPWLLVPQRGGPLCVRTSRCPWPGACTVLWGNCARVRGATGAPAGVMLAAAATGPPSQGLATRCACCPPACPRAAHGVLCPPRLEGQCTGRRGLELSSRSVWPRDRCEGGCGAGEGSGHGGERAPSMGVCNLAARGAGGWEPSPDVIFQQWVKAAHAHEGYCPDPAQDGLWGLGSSSTHSLCSGSSCPRPGSHPPPHPHPHPHPR